MPSTNFVLISHTGYSRDVERSSIIGEIPNAKKLQTLLLEMGYHAETILDTYELFNIAALNDDNAYAMHKLAKLNVDLATIGEDFLIDEKHPLSLECLKKVQEAAKEKENTVLIFLTWLLNTYAFLSTGLHHSYPNVGKYYCWHAGELQSPDVAYLIKPYLEMDLIITESLLGPIEGIKAGIEPWRFLYFPNIYPSEAKAVYHLSDEEKSDFRNEYLQRVAAANKKSIDVNEDTIVIAYPARFQRRKNIEFIIEAVHRLHKEFPNIILLLKGDYAPNWDQNTFYTEKIHHLIHSAKKQPWFLLDMSYTPFPEIFQIYNSFDICTYLSGAEIGNNTLVELLYMGVPTILPDTTVFPYTFCDMVSFVKARRMLFGKVGFKQPEMEDLVAKLKELIVSPEKRQKLGKKAHMLAEERFDPKVITERIPLLVEAANSFHKHDDREKKCQELLTETLYRDLDAYNLRGMVP